MFLEYFFSLTLRNMSSDEAVKVIYHWNGKENYVGALSRPTPPAPPNPTS